MDRKTGWENHSFRQKTDSTIVPRIIIAQLPLLEPSRNLFFLISKDILPIYSVNASAFQYISLHKVVELDSIACNQRTQTYIYYLIIF